MARDDMRQREDRAIEAFVAAIAISDGQPGIVTSRPDREGTRGGADAIVRRLELDWAVEHTTIDSFPGQRADDVRLRRVFEPACKAIALAYPMLRITIGIPPGAVPTGTSWSSITAQFSREVITALQDHGDTPGNRHIVLPGLFESGIFYRYGRARGCFLSREVDSADIDPRVTVIAGALSSKVAQLAPYRANGMPTALLLDNDDIGLMSPDVIASAFARATAVAPLAGLDEVYLVDGTEAPPWIYPLKLGARQVPDLPAFNDFFEEQYRKTYGD